MALVQRINNLNRQPYKLHFSIFIIIFVLIFCTVIKTHATNEAADDSTNGFWPKRYDELKSPWTTQARPWLLYGGATTLTLAILEDQIVDPAQEDTVEDEPLGSASIYGDLAGQMIPNAVYAIGMGLHYWYTKNQKSSESALAMIKASAYSGAVAQSLKYIVHEPRPNNSAGNRSYESFPSGHTTSAFAFSSTVIAQHGFWPYGLMATTLASFAGFSRINDNKHYLHDVVGGFTIGTAYGLGITYLQQGKNINKSEMVASRWSVYPAYSAEIKGLIAYYEF